MSQPALLHKPFVSALLVFFHFLNQCLLALSASAPVHSETNSDWRALLCLKSQLHDPSGVLASWRNDSNSTICDWHGVTCNRRHASRVISLDFESANITGQIFPCIANLSFVSRIHMPGNQLNGHISPEIGRLTRLSYLNLSMNSLSGEIPASISSCSRLEIIDLCRNSLEGEIPPSLGECSLLREIILSNNNILGRIPPQVGVLPYLSAFFIPNNKLSGNIPKLLGSSYCLTWMNLQNNTLNGEIPPYLFNSTSLTYIDLSYNDLSGSIPPFWQTSSSLRYLSLTENNLSGGIPTSVGNLSSLTTLLISKNNLGGTIQESLSKVSSLQTLDLSYNNLSGTVPPRLYTIANLTYLNLGANRLVGTIPKNIGYTLPRITSLILEGNQIEGHIPASLANASNLQIMHLRSNAFTGVIPSLGSLSRLTYFDVGANRLEAGDWNFLSSLTNCTQLQILCLDRNNLKGIIPSSIVNLSKGLKVLILIQNQLTGSIPLEIGNLTSLTVLQMDSNLLSGHIPNTLVNIRNLSILSLSRNKLSGEIPRSIGKLEQLTKLYLEENDLTGHIPTSLARCTNLLTLNLSRNNLDGSIPTDIFSISTLSEGLDISYNRITGQIPLQIGKLINLNSLSISNNQLSGDIPDALGECVLLESVHLEVNLLQGHIPRSLVNLRGISEMDLSLNNLSGEIPKYFESFSFLSILNLSFNNLEGPVPKGGVFANSSEVSIQGNRKLCAISPMQQVPLCKELPSKRKKTSYGLSVVVPITTMVIVTLACVAIILRKRRNGSKVIMNHSFKQFNKLSYKDLYKATNGFCSSCLVGSGRYGLVYKGKLEFELRNVAIKVFRLDQNGAPNIFLDECEALKNIRHRNVIKVISLCSTLDPSGNEFKALILEFRANGNLESWLHPKLCNENHRRPLSLGSRISIVVDIATALDYLHNRCTPPLVHCDLKPSNVLLDDEMVACLSDFGLAKFLHRNFMGLHDSSSIAGPRGSIGYIAPEYGLGCEISTEGDVYSYGIILLEIITGKRPTDDMFKDGMDLHNFVESSFPHKTNEIIEPIIAACHEAEEQNHIVVEMRSCITQLAKLGLMCTETLPKDRPTMEDVYVEIISIKEKFSAMPIEEIDEHF